MSWDYQTACEHFGVREWGRRAPLAVRILRAVRVDGDCWIWQKSLDMYGYGRVGYVQSRQAKRAALAHRASYEVLVGDIADGLTLDHLCRNRACVNPSHLEAVTQGVNLHRGSNFAAVNARKTHCVRNHAYTEENTARRNGRRYCRTCQDQRNAWLKGRTLAQAAEQAAQAGAA